MKIFNLVLGIISALLAGKSFIYLKIKWDTLTLFSDARDVSALVGIIGAMSLFGLITYKCIKPGKPNRLETTFGVICLCLIIFGIPGLQMLAHQN